MQRLLTLVKIVGNRIRFAVGLKPLSQSWYDRGIPLNRFYLEQFLQEFSCDIRGHCLEFQEDVYASRFGGGSVSKLDILHKESGNPSATIVADLTQPNAIPSNSYDCIICTYTLHIVFDFNKMISELYRILKEKGVLLIVVPTITVCYPRYHELWRFTPEGMESLLSTVFGEGNITIRSYGNSLTAAGFVRGLAARDFTQTELDHHDSPFTISVLARALKTKQS